MLPLTPGTHRYFIAAHARRCVGSSHSRTGESRTLTARIKSPARCHYPTVPLAIPRARHGFLSSFARCVRHWIDARPPTGFTTFCDFFRPVFRSPLMHAASKLDTLPPGSDSEEGAHAVGSRRRYWHHHHH